MAAEWCGVTCCGATPLASPVLEQEGPEHVGTVLCLDLVGDDHLLHHLMRDAWEGLLVQIKEHGTWGKIAQRRQRHATVRLMVTTTLLMRRETYTYCVEVQITWGK